MQKLCVIGPGRWGSFQAWYANRIGFEVNLLGQKVDADFAELKASRKNGYLSFPDSIHMTDDADEALSNSDFVCIAIPAQQLRSLCKTLGNYSPKAWILCMKGIESSTGKRLSEVFIEETGKQNVAVWAGPGHVQEFLKGHPNAMVITGPENNLAEELCERFNSDLIRFYHSTDLIGTEIGAAAKNVVGLAAGMLDGMDFGTLKGALMARGALEISRLVGALGGDPRTVYGLSHLGDYEATLFSPWSQNRGYGEAIARGESYSKLAEGVPTVKALLKLAGQTRVDMPITSALHSILFEKQPPKKALAELFLRPLKSEFS